jgi:hypothetical protein
MLRTGRVYLGGRADGQSSDAPPSGFEASAGWRWDERGEDGPSSGRWTPAAGAVRVGWLDAGEAVAYLAPTEAIREVAEYTRSLRAGEIPNAEVIYRELAGRGLIARASPKRHTVTIRVGGDVVRVLALKAEAVLSDEGSQETGA